MNLGEGSAIGPPEGSHWLRSPLAVRHEVDSLERCWETSRDGTSQSSSASSSWPSRRCASSLGSSPSSREDRLAADEPGPGSVADRLLDGVSRARFVYADVRRTTCVAQRREEHHVRTVPVTEELVRRPVLQHRSCRRHDHRHCPQLLGASARAWQRDPSPA